MKDPTKTKGKILIAIILADKDSPKPGTSLILSPQVGHAIIICKNNIVLNKNTIKYLNTFINILYFRFEIIIYFNEIFLVESLETLTTPLVFVESITFFSTT